MENHLEYNPTDPKSIENHGKKLIGRTFRDILEYEIDNEEKLLEEIERYNNPYSKGSLGELVEEYHYKYQPNSDANPDFPGAKTELKTTPYETTKSGKIRAGERLVISMIPNREPITLNFEDSHLRDKIEIIMFIIYCRNKSIPRTDYRIEFATLFSIFGDKCKEDLEIIIEDYNTIVKKIQDGRAHELSESDTMYLGACTKGATSNKSLQPQYYNPGIPAKRRAFSFKQSFMTYILNRYLNEGVITYEPIFSSNDLEHIDFETALKNKLSKFIGYSEQALYAHFDVNGVNNKAANSQMVLRMLGVYTDNAEEFEKANIEIKTIRVNKKGMPRESMSFPAFRIEEFINEEEFEETELYRFFSETKFLFVIFLEKEDGLYYLKDTKLWNMPIIDLENQGYHEWKLFQNHFKNGVTFQLKKLKNGNTIINNDLPKGKDTNIFHIRPHASKSAYLVQSLNYSKGDIDRDGDRLPNGDYMTKQCFWLNGSYIKDQIQELL